MASRAVRSTATDEESNRPEGDAFRAAFDSESRTSCLRGASAYCVLSGLVILATIPLDRVRFPELAGRLLPIRLAGITAMAAILALLGSDYGRRRPRAVGLLPPSASGALVQAIAFATGGHMSPVNVDTNFAILGVALLMPWTMVWSALACLVLVGEYVGATVASGTLRDPRFTDTFLVFAAASGLAIVTTAVRERWSRREFARRWTLAAAHRDARASAERYRSLVEAAGGVILCGQDITERKCVQEALRASEARLRTVMTGAPIVLFTCDQAGICTLSEGRGLARLGLRPGEVVGLHFSEVLAGFVSDPDRSAGYFQRALAGEKVTWLGSSGEMIFECRLTPVHDAEERVSGVIGVAIDVSERERAENARLALERKLLEAKRLESLGVLAGGVAHDFNNLLVNVLGNASLAASGLPDDSPVRESLRRIEAAARRGSELTRQMLAYAGKEPVSLQGGDVNAAVEDTIELLNVSIPVGGVVRPELAERLPEPSGDPSQVRQVLMNLVINAAEAVGDAGTITVRTAAVQLDETGIRRMHPGSQAAG